MGNNRDFDALPPEVQGIILNFINEKKAMTSGASVSHAWHAFFHPKLKDAFLLDFLANDKDACKKITLEQLTEAVDIFLRSPNSQKITDLFLALKKFESEIIDITVNPNRAIEKQTLTIDRPAIQSLLKNRFGLAGLIHSRSIMDVFGAKIVQDSLIPLLALEKLMQQNPDKYNDTLELVNLLGKHQIFIVQSEAGSFKAKFGFADNHLYLEMGEGGHRVQLSDILLVHLGPQENPVFVQKTQELLQELAEVESKKGHAPKIE